MGAKAEENLISDRDTVDETREKLISRDFVLIKQKKINIHKLRKVGVGDRNINQKGILYYT